MKLSYGSALATCLIAGRATSAEEATLKVRNVAIIGAGAAGSSAAYHLRQFADLEDVPVNVTIFEKTDRIGGRSLTVDAYDDPLQRIELGASIFVTVNHVLYNATQKYNLSLGALRTDSQPDDVTAIWDGKSFVFESTDSTSWWWGATKMFWRYGMSPYNAVKLVNQVVGKFLKLYEPPFFPFRSLTARVYELDLVGITALTGEQFLQQSGINEAFSREIIQAATRVNYASNLAYIHGLEAMVSFATDGAVSVSGGNWRIFEKFVQNSEAAVFKNTAIKSISFAETDAPNKYVLEVQSTDGEKEPKPETYPTVFDDVIIASPWQFSDIKAGEGVIKHHIEKIPYTKLHVTLFTSPFKLQASFFGLEPGSKAPINVYTTLAEGEKPKQGAEGVGSTGFYSVSTLRTVVNPSTKRLEYAYKIFSPHAVTPEFLTKLLGVDIPSTFVTLNEAGDTTRTGVEPISWYYPHWFYSYPIELPRVTFQDPIIGNGLYYTSGIESFISTMETSALMGMNVARLIVDDVIGINREYVEVTKEQIEREQKRLEKNQRSETVDEL